MKTFIAWLNENSQRTGSKVGLYPPLYTLSQYPDNYYTPIAADYITYHSMQKDKPIKTTPKTNPYFDVVTPDSKGRVKRFKELE